MPQADGTLVALPVGRGRRADAVAAHALRRDGHRPPRGRRRAGCGPGKIVAVVGDGAVGLCGVIAAKRLGAEQIIMLGRHPDRIALAREFGATDVVSERGDAAIERVRELTGGLGAHSVLECVGHGESMRTALSIARAGGAVGRVGVPQDDDDPAARADVLRQRHHRRRPGAGARLHRGAAARRARGPDRAGPRVRSRRSTSTACPTATAR